MKHTSSLPLALQRVAAVALLQSLSLAQGISILDIAEGPGQTTYFGERFEDIGDCNGDGISDIAVGMRRGNAIRVISGRDRSLIFERNPIIPNPPGFGGQIVEAAGDFDGDGRGDIIVGFVAFNPFASVSRVQVCSGLDGSVLLEIASPGPSTSFPSSVGRPLDVDGDGILDLIVSDVLANSDAGIVFAFSGATGAEIWRTDGYMRERLGIAFTLMDDLDGDGVAEIGVSGRNGIALNSNNPGQVRILSGASGVSLARREGAVAYQDLGRSLATVADRNGDGVRDIATIRNVPASDSGVVFLSGVDLLPIGQILAPQGVYAFGISIDESGDFNGDGTPDLLVGAIGEASVYSGSSGALLARVQDASQFFGNHVRYLRDVDGDGLAEVMVGRHFRDPGQLIIYESTPANGGVICVGRPNGVGSRAQLVADSPSGYSAAAGDLTLRASGLPPKTFGLFLVGNGRGLFVDFLGSRGTLCIGDGGFGRFVDDVVFAGAGGTASLSPDMSAFPWTEAGAFGPRSVAPGETYGFQLWYRDGPTSALNTSNFTDAVTVTFR